jgi:SAM-dependent methyltransferase
MASPWRKRKPPVPSLACHVDTAARCRYESAAAKEGDRMAGWNDGYVTDVPYTASFFRECTPGWLALATLLVGHRPPDLTRRLRFVELGCGFGFTATTVAASLPSAEVWACDFNPAHVEGARRLAADAGLTNIDFAENSFAEIAADSSLGPAEVDIIVLHGIYSWISAENRAHIVSFIRQRLVPGGLVYISYNVTTGWASMLPVRELMRLVAASGTGRTDLIVPDTVAYLDRLKESGSMFFANNPTVETRLAGLKGHDPRYIAHEYLNADWHPMMFAEVAGEMADAKCAFIGSASITDNMPSTSVPAGMFPLLTEARDIVLRETLRDFGSGQGFRRDLFRRGTGQLSGPEHLAMLDAITLVSLGKPIEAEITFASTVGTITGKDEIYRPLIEFVAQGPATIAEIRALPIFAAMPVAEPINAVALIVAGGYAHPALPNPAGAAPSRRLNRALARANEIGGEATQLVSPVLGSSISSNLIETLILGALDEAQAGGQGAPDDAALIAHVRQLLSRTGRNLQHNHATITDPVEIDRTIAQTVDAARQRIAGILTELGVADP